MGSSTRMPVIVLQFVGGKLQTVFEGVRLDAQMVADAETVGRRLNDPVDVAADQVQQFAADHRDLGGIDAIGAVDRAAAALRALIEVVEPLLDDLFGQFPAGAEEASAAR